MRSFLRHIFESFLADFLRIYRILPKDLRRRARRVFAGIIVLALLEVAAIVSISLLAVSIAAPENLREYGPVPRLLAMSPWLGALCDDPRLLSLAISSAVVLLTLAKNAMSACMGVAAARFGERVSLAAGETIFRHYLHSPFVAHLAGDAQAMFQALAWRGQLSRMIIDLMSVYTYAAITLALLISLLSATPGSMLLVVLAVAAAAALIYKKLKGGMDKAGSGAAECGRRENAVAMNAMHGIREILIYRQQAVFAEKFRRACLGGLDDRTFLAVAPPIPAWVLESAGFLVIPLTLLTMYVLQDASMARITGVLTMIMLICWRVLPLLNRSLACMITVRGIRHSALDCLARVETALADPAPEPEAPDPDFVLSRSIALEGASFRYPRAQGDCLHALSFSIARGSCVGIVGRSGAGKSSLAAIVSGLAAPTAGSLLIDGRTLSPAGLAAYRLGVGYVPQSPYILAETLAENVAFSRWGRPWDEERVREVCRMAELDIAEERGTALAVGAGGVGLSGGQAQRLAIARALYAAPALLILDEATSALDSGVEAAIMKTIFALPQGMTTVIIAHRLATVERCDRLLWIERGSLVACGPPGDVLPEYERFLQAAGSERAKRP
jgi:ABC-type multidrug transport system fused ATPase/permease subunit